jgi:hypothetical protein
MLHYGLPEHIADVPETWPVWHAGNARTACLGILMLVFYAQRRYDILDTFLIITGAYLGLVDCFLLRNERLLSTGLFALSALLRLPSWAWEGSRRVQHRISLMHSRYRLITGIFNAT